MNENLVQLLSQIQPKLKNAVMCIKVGDEITMLSSNCTTLNTQYYIGETTLQITSYMYLSMLKSMFPTKSLDSLVNMKVQELFPNSTVLSYLDADAYTNLTSLKLLSYSTGLSNYMPDEIIDIDYVLPPYEMLIMFPEMVDYFNQITEQYQQATKYNEAFDAATLLNAAQASDDDCTGIDTSGLLLAKLMEESTGASYSQHFADTVKVLAQMDNTYAPNAGNYQALKLQPELSNLAADMNHTNFYNLANVLGSENIISTAEDLINWNDFFYNHADPEIRNLMLKQYHEIEENIFITMGAFNKNIDAGNAYFTYGSTDSYNSFLLHIDGKYDIAVLTNNEDDYTLISSVLDTVL